MARTEKNRRRRPTIPSRRVATGEQADDAADRAGRRQLVVRRREGRGSHVRTLGSRTAVHQVGHEVREDDRDGEEHEDPLEDGVVAGGEGLDGERPEARPAEHDLHRDRAGDHVAQVDRDERHRRQHGVRQRVVAQDRSSRRPIARAVVT